MIIADAVFANGDIVTMNDASPAAAAIAIKDGKIVAAGSEDEVAANVGPNTRRIDLGGKTLLPGFIDGHSHFINAVRMAGWANVSAPPVGPVRNIADLISALKAKKRELNLQPGEWLVGYGYDGAMIEDVREATREDLDPDFPDNPVMAMHVSLHGAVLNTAGFAAAKFDLFAPTPPGGMTARKTKQQRSGGPGDGTFVPADLHEHARADRAAATRRLRRGAATLRRQRLHHGPGRSDGAGDPAALPQGGRTGTASTSISSAM